MLSRLVIPSPLGPLTLIASPLGIRQIEFADLGTDPEPANSLTGASILAAAASQLTSYFARERQTFSLPIDLKGTPFQMQVWRTLQRVPFGETRSYGWLAGQIGDPQAAQAVGQANGKNPIPIIVPCHRIVGSDGAMTGYVGGIDRKQWLLALEGAMLPLAFSGEPPP